MKVYLPLREYELDAPQDNLQHDRSDRELVEPVEARDRRLIVDIEPF